MTDIDRSNQALFGEHAYTASVSIQGGLATTEAGVTVDLLKIQAICSFAFQELGDHAFAEASDLLSQLTGVVQGPHGEWLANDDAGLVRGELPVDLNKLPEVLTSLTREQKEQIQTTLANDEASTDEEVLLLWINECDISPIAAKAAIRYRSHMFKKPMHDLFGLFPGVGK